MPSEAWSTTAVSFAVSSCRSVKSSPARMALDTDPARLASTGRSSLASFHENRPPRAQGMRDSSPEIAEDVPSARADAVGPDRSRRITEPSRQPGGSRCDGMVSASGPAESASAWSAGVAAYSSLSPWRADLKERPSVTTMTSSAPKNRRTLSAAVATSWAGGCGVARVVDRPTV